MARQVQPKPFSVFKRATANTYIIKFKGRQYSTGIEATPSNLKLAENYGMQLYQDYLKNNCELPTRSNHKRVADVFKLFYNERKISHASGTLYTYRQAYRTLISDPNLLLKPKTISDHIQRQIATTTLHANTLDICRRAINTFFNWCVKRGHLQRMPEMIWPKPIPKKIEIWSDDELLQLLPAADKYDVEFGALLRLLANTALRIHEALELKWSDVTVNTLHLVSKDGKRSESLPLTTGIADILGKVPRRGIYVFRWRVNSTSRLHGYLRDVCMMAGVEKGARSFHAFRKSFISRMANAGIDVRQAAELARQGIDVMMKYYTVLSTESKKATMEKMAITG